MCKKLTHYKEPLGMASHNDFHLSSPPADCVCVWQILPPQPQANDTNPNPNNLEVALPQTLLPDIDTKPKPKTLGDKIGVHWFCMLILILIIVVIIATVLGIYFGNAPRPNLQVYAVFVCPFNISGSYITSKWDFYLLLRNPYHNSFYYSLFDLSLFYKSKFLSGNSIEPFVQPRKDQRAIKVKLDTSSMYVEDRVMEDIIAEKNTGVVKFDLKMKVNIWTRWFSTMDKMKLNIICEDIMVGVPSNTSVGRFLGRPRKCKVKRR